MSTYVNGVLQIASDQSALHAPRITSGQILFIPWAAALGTTQHTAGRLLGTLLHIPRPITISDMSFQVTAGNIANYTTGTAAFTNGSNQVVGTDTVFAATHVGSRIKNNTDAVWHTILSVEDATHLTLTANYSAAGGAAAAYTINHTARVGLYTADSALLATGAVLLSDMGIGDISSTGIKTVTATVSLAKGYYIAAFFCGTTPTIVNFTAGHSGPMGLAITTFQSGGYATLYKESTYGVLPATFPTPDGGWAVGYVLPVKISSLN